jgi:hypothetical protein
VFVQRLRTMPCQATRPKISVFSHATLSRGGFSVYSGAALSLSWQCRLRLEVIVACRHQRPTCHARLQRDRKKYHAIAVLIALQQQRLHCIAAVDCYNLLLPLAHLSPRACRCRSTSMLRLSCAAKLWADGASGRKLAE